MGVETSFANLVGSAFHSRKSGVYRRRGREFHRTRSSQRKSAVAFPMRRVGIFFADDLRGRWKTIRGGGCRDRVVFVRIAVVCKKCEQDPAAQPESNCS